MHTAEAAAAPAVAPAAASGKRFHPRGRQSDQRRGGKNELKLWESGFYVLANFLPL